jgi:hypothetical protein
MLSGKAISRAIRGHFLVYTALALLMITEIYEIDINILDKIHWDDKENTAHEVDDNESEHGVNIPDEVSELLYVIDKLLDGSIPCHRTRRKQCRENSEKVAVVAAAVDILDASLTAAAGNILLVDVENACLVVRGHASF